MQHESSTADQKVARIAEKQQGNATKRQLRAAGLTLAEIRVRRERGALLPVFRASTERLFLIATGACHEGRL